jgi:O-antigen ligase
VLLMVLVPAVLPVFDLAPWSGRRFIDEFDMLLLLLLAVAWAGVPAPPKQVARRAEHCAFALLVLAIVVGTSQTLWPWPAADLADPGNPLSPLNSLRLAKGVLGAWGLWWMARRLQAIGANVGSAFGWGMTLGLLGTVLAILVERLAFSYLLDFGSDYRIAGPFSVMSLGGAYVECFLAVATPFLMARLLPPVSASRLAMGGGLLAAAAYSLMITFSRGGYAAMAVGVVVMLLCVLLARQQRWQRVAVITALTGLAGAVAYPVLMGTFAQARLKTVSADLNIRERHWAESLTLLDHEGLSPILGIGLGRFAEGNFWAGPEGERAGGHRLITDGDSSQALRLGAGYAYFVDQIVPVRPGEHYQLSYRVRMDGPKGSMGVALCQKWIISSFECGLGKPAAAASKPTAPTQGSWQTVAYDMVGPGAGPGRLPRPVRLSLYNSGRSPVSVDQVSLISAGGVEMVRNGGFRTGMDHWTFTSDNHLVWHTKSMFLGVLVELGLLGVVATLALLMVGAWRAGLAAWHGRPDGMALLAALCAFATVGLIDTLVDAPRFLMLWLLLCLLPSALPETSSRHALS